MKKMTKKELQALLEEKIKELEEVKKERDEYLDLARRIAADFDNYRKRMERREEEMRLFASENILRQFLPLVDDLERAYTHLPNDSNLENFRKGMEMLLKRFHDFLKSHHVEKFTSIGKEFDPHLHEAVAVEGEGDKEIVVEELEPGYLFHGKLFRPAKVKVRKVKEGVANES